ncbi:Daple [Actinoplanes utahensis]|uniref:Daple n=2 Tax=Actinoplanes utahensis TaxID=1869 RepID=UPI001F47E0EC|nr:Daple [Actinoplanes utahensis]
MEQGVDTPPWRRPSDGRVFGRQQVPGERPFGVTPPSDVPASQPGPEIPPSEGWPTDRSRLADILGHRPPPGGVPMPPSSAPPYPYEGDLDDSYSQRAPVPMPRPDWLPDPVTPPAAPVAAEPVRSRHALVTDTLAQGLPQLDNPIAESSAYDSPSFQRTPTHAPPTFADSDGVETDADSDRNGVLPQRVPAQPDVPRVPEPPSVEPSAEAPALARIATHLRRGDVVPARERQEGFDVQDILAAVREVEGVRDASLRATPAGAHSLRLDLADGADPAEVSRQVARLLQDRMGLDAAMPGDPPAALRPSSAPVSSARTPLLPSQPARAAAPVAPVSSPTRPVSTPVRPVSSPARPVSSPVRPVSSPARPVSSPVAPASSTAASVSSPVRPVSSVPAPVSSPPAPAPAPAPAPVPVAPPVSAPPPTAPPVSTPLATAPPVSAPPATAAPISTPAALVPADASKPRPLDPGGNPGPRVIIENVHVNTFGADATVEVRLRAGGRAASGVATGPAVDGYLLRLCATATAGAVDDLLAGSEHPDGPARCFVEHASAVSFGPMQVAVVVLLLSCGGGWVEQLAGSAVVTGDDRHAMVRATLAAVNRRLEALLA